MIELSHASLISTLTFLYFRSRSDRTRSSEGQLIHPPIPVYSAGGCQGGDGQGGGKSQGIVPLYNKHLTALLVDSHIIQTNNILELCVRFNSGNTAIFFFNYCVYPVYLREQTSKMFVVCLYYSLQGSK